MSTSSLPEATMEKDRELPTITNVKSPKALLSLIKNLHSLPTESPSIFLDAEWFRDQKATFLHLFVPSENTIYRLKIDEPRSVDLSTTIPAGVSLSSILESESIPKVVFDVRRISKALFDQHDISLDGIQDLQLMELASRDAEQSKKYIAGLAKCVETGIPRSNEVRKRWFESENIDKYHLSNVLGHASRSSMYRIELFPTLWNTYHERLRRPREAFWLAQSHEQASCRIIEAQRPSFKISDKKNALGPEDWVAKKRRDELMDNFSKDKKLNEDTAWIQFG
ncbi:hypothetical protein Hte_008289 [Hypoxylon texense]